MTNHFQIGVRLFYVITQNMNMHTDDILKYPFLMQKAVKKWPKMTPCFLNTSKKINFLTLMADFRCMFLEINKSVIKIQFRWFQMKIATSRVYVNCQL